MTSFPDYYTILGIQETATTDEIRTAYKKQSLIHHPDRIPAGPGSEVKRKAATVQFQGISDAFYTLSDPSRRSAYDRTRAQQSNRTGDASASSSYFDFFSGLAGAASGKSKTGTTRPDANYMFGDVFEDMLRPELEKGGLPIWRVIGAGAGAAIGFIGGNLPGAAIGAYAGSKLGQVRDSKGKAVYEVFKDLGADQKAEVLKGLVAKVFGMTGIGGAASR